MGVLTISDWFYGKEHSATGCRINAIRKIEELVFTYVERETRHKKSVGQAGHARIPHMKLSERETGLEPATSSLGS